MERQPDHLAECYEAGTLNVPGIVGLGVAVDYLLDEGIEKGLQQEDTRACRFWRD